MPKPMANRRACVAPRPPEAWNTHVRFQRKELMSPATYPIALHAISGVPVKVLSRYITARVTRVFITPTAR